MKKVFVTAISLLLTVKFLIHFIKKYKKNYLLSFMIMLGIFHLDTNRHKCLSYYSENNKNRITFVLTCVSKRKHLLS